MSIIYNLIYNTFKSLPPIYVQKGQKMLYPVISIQIDIFTFDSLHKDENNQAFLNNKSISEEELKEYIATLKNVKRIALLNRLDLDNPLTGSILFQCPKFCGRYYKPNDKKENCKNKTDPHTMKYLANMNQFEIITITFEDNVKYCIPFSHWQLKLYNDPYQFINWVPKPGETKLLDSGDNGMPGQVKIYTIRWDENPIFFVIEKDTIDQMLETKKSSFYVKKVTDNVRVANYIYTHHPNKRYSSKDFPRSIKSTRGGIPEVPLYIVYSDENNANVYIEKIKKQLAGKEVKFDLLNWVNQYGYDLKNEEELYNLKRLDFAGQLVTIIPKEIGQLTNLIVLDLENNNLKKVTKELGELTNLKELNLNINELEEIPKELGELINLRKLNLSENKLKKIPKELGKLTNLKELDLRFNKLEEIPEELGELTNLEELYLKYNKFT